MSSGDGVRMAGSVTATVHPAGDPGGEPRQEDENDSGATATGRPKVTFIPGQAVELAVQVGSWVEGTPCLIVNREQTYSPYEWRVTVLRDCGALDASMYEHELRPRRPSRLEQLIAQADEATAAERRAEKVAHEWLVGFNDWAADAIGRELDKHPGYADGEAVTDDDPWGVDPFDTAVDALFREAFNLLLSKHHDYGPRNISQAPGGALNGLAVRLHDKLSRLSHLLQSDDDPNHESLRDTLLDVMNYGAIGVLVCDGNWPSD